MVDDRYIEFIASPEWREKRQQRLEIDDYRCQACGTRSDLRVHHLVYSRFGGDELMSDLVTVCNSCHQAIHSAAKGGISIEQATARVLRKMQDKRARPSSAKKHDARVSTPAHVMAEAKRRFGPRDQ